MVHHVRGESGFDTSCHHIGTCCRLCPSSLHSVSHSKYTTQVLRKLWHCSIEYNILFNINRYCKYTVLIINIWTDRSWQESADPGHTQSNRVYTACHSVYIFWVRYCTLKPHSHWSMFMSACWWQCRLQQNDFYTSCARWYVFLFIFNVIRLAISVSLSWVLQF